MADWIFICWSCQRKTPMQAPVRRLDSCTFCLTDMHACKNCRFYDPGAHNQCVEVIAEYVPDKARSNFCGMFEADTADKPKGPDLNAARAKLEALFGK